MRPGQKAWTIGGITGLSLDGVVQTVDYLWVFTNLAPLPNATSLIIAGPLVAGLYRIMPPSQR